MSLTLHPKPVAAHTVTVWMSDGSPVSGDAPAGACLTTNERRLAQRLKSPARRRSFETARRLGKQATAAWMNFGPSTDAFHRIEILSEDPTGITSRPVVVIDEEPADLNISITHQEDRVAVAVTDSHSLIGLDLAVIERPSAGFSEFWMTEQEQEQIDVSEDAALTATMNWSVREAAFKAVGIDSEFRPANWSVSFHDGRAACFHRGERQPVELSFYRVRSDLLLTVASDASNIAFQSTTAA